jgi:hypothetical protein
VVVAAQALGEEGEMDQIAELKSVPSDKEPDGGKKGAMIGPVRRAGIIALLSTGCLGLLSAVVGAFFQYHSWRAEEDLARYREAFAAATETLTNTSQSLSAVMNLQESLYVIFQQANDPNVDKIDRSFLTEVANQVYGDYSKAQNDLSQRIEIIAQMMEIRIDWPTDQSRDPAVDFDDSIDPLARGVFASRSLLSEFHFDCLKHFPSLESKRLELVEQGKDTKLSIDWLSVKHQVVALYYCLDKMHLDLKAVREWAFDKQVDDARYQSVMSQQEAVRAGLDTQALRLNALIKLSTKRLNDIRRRYETKGLIAFYLCGWVSLPWCTS